MRRLGARLAGLALLPQRDHAAAGEVARKPAQQTVRGTALKGEAGSRGTILKGKERLLRQFFEIRK